MRILLAGLAAVAVATAVGAQPACEDNATLTVFVENLSSAPSLEITVDGEVAPDAVPCSGSGATTYPATTLTCTGTGIVRCGQIPGLLPGAWVHRITVTVPDSDPQEEALRLVLVGGGSNALLWPVYPRTF